MLARLGGLSYLNLGVAGASQGVALRAGIILIIEIIDIFVLFEIIYIIAIIVIIGVVFEGTR